MSKPAGEDVRNLLAEMKDISDKFLPPWAYLRKDTPQIIASHYVADRSAIYVFDNRLVIMHDSMLHYLRRAFSPTEDLAISPMELACMVIYALLQKEKNTPEAPSRTYGPEYRELIKSQRLGDLQWKNWAGINKDMKA